MEKNENILMSVVDIEKKYTYDPAETVYGGEQVVSWGLDNNIPKLLNNCYEKSATLKAAIDQSINYVLGDGLVINPDAGLWLEKVNRRGETMEDLVGHIIFDYFTYGNYAIQVIFNKLGIPVELYALDVARCRLNGNKDKVFYSKKTWTKYQQVADVFDRFGYAEIDPEKPTQIYFYNGSGVRSVYNKAPWAAALNDVLCEIEGSEYSLNSVVNGFSARYVLNIPDTSNLTDEQKRDIENSIKTKFTGPDANTFMLYFTNDEGKNIEVRKIESDETPERFVAIRNSSRENIFVSLRISPLLCGLGGAVGSTGFATQEFSDSYKLYDRTVAEPIRHLIERTLEKILGIQDARDWRNGKGGDADADRPRKRDHVQQAAFCPHQAGL